jgi:anti-sigma factor ChrR (cupin superfamily)
MEIVKPVTERTLRMQTVTVVRASDLSWQASPSPSVWRKRLFLEGPSESGTVTSLVRFDPGSTFPRHGHPDGEEVFVLEGVYSDERGSFPAGTYLLSPDGFEHEPFSAEGCLLLVRLRQYPGLDREQVVVDTKAGSWATVAPGVRRQPLYHSASHADSKWLLELQPGTALSPGEVPDGVEIFVLDGEFENERGRYPRHTWLSLPPGSTHAARSATGCVLYISTPRPAHPTCLACA